MILGSVDNVNTERVIGWVHSALSPAALRVQATINNQVVGEADAGLFRPDLAEAGLGTGHCGFEIRFENAIDVAYLPFLEIRPAGSTLALPRTSMAGFSDYFSWLYKKYPSVGRYASIFGGFWTDRSDAIALLKGRTDIGAITAGDSGVLSRFITEGIVIVELDSNQERAFARSATKGAARKPDVAAEISGCFFDVNVLRLVRSIIDDNPIAVKASKCVESESGYMQPSGWEELPSPPECLALVVPLGEGVSIEVLRGSHRFPEFVANGLSRWTRDGRRSVEAAGVSPNVCADLFSISSSSVAVLGPGMLHRIHASPTNIAVRVLVLPSRHGSVRFRQQVPTDEVAHRSGARIWVS